MLYNGTHKGFTPDDPIIDWHDFLLDEDLYDVDPLLWNFIDPFDDDKTSWWFLQSLREEKEAEHPTDDLRVQAPRNATHLEFTSSATGNTYKFDLVTIQWTPHRTGGIWKIGEDTYTYSKEDDCWKNGASKLKFIVEVTDLHNGHELHYGKWTFISPDSTQTIANRPFEEYPHTSELTFTIGSQTLSANWHASQP